MLLLFSPLSTMNAILLTECCLKTLTQYTIAFFPVSIRNKSFALTVNPICTCNFICNCMNCCSILTSSRVLGLLYSFVLSTCLLNEYEYEYEYE